MGIEFRVNKRSSNTRLSIGSGRLFDFDAFNIHTMVNNVYVRDFGDSYHREKTEEEQEVLKMRSQYSDPEEYAEAVEMYEDYIEAATKQDESASVVMASIDFISPIRRSISDGTYDLLVPNKPRYTGTSEARKEFAETGQVVKDSFNNNSISIDEKKLIAMLALRDSLDLSSDIDGNINIQDIDFEIDPDIYEGIDSDNDISMYEAMITSDSLSTSSAFTTNSSRMHEVATRRRRANDTGASTVLDLTDAVVNSASHMHMQVDEYGDVYMVDNSEIEKIVDMANGTRYIPESLSYDAYVSEMAYGGINLDAQSNIGGYYE